jgi:hypothetical protein
MCKRLWERLCQSCWRYYSLMHIMSLFSCSLYSPGAAAAAAAAAVIALQSDPAFVLGGRTASVFPGFSQGTNSAKVRLRRCTCCKLKQACQT